jgi:hypothetical protein
VSSETFSEVRIKLNRQLFFTIRANVGRARSLYDVNTQVARQVFVLSAYCIA